MSFAQLTTRARWVNGHVVLARRLEHPRFRRIDTISRRNHVHHFQFNSVSEVDAEVEAWLTEAYAVGAQKHLSGRIRRAIQLSGSIGIVVGNFRTAIARALNTLRRPGRELNRVRF